jgi:hypothetical protein
MLRIYFLQNVAKRNVGVGDSLHPQIRGRELGLFKILNLVTTQPVCQSQLNAFVSEFVS